jgi:hypothetical protein
MDKIEQALLTSYDKEIQAAYDHYQELILLAEKYGQDVIALRERQAEAVAEVEKKYAEQAAREAQSIKEEEAGAIGATANKMFENLAILSEKNTKAQKATAVAQATWNTFQAVTAALGAQPYGAWNIAQAVATGAFGLLQVKKILSTNVGSAGGGSIASASGTQIAQNTPQFQLNSLINGQSQSQLQRAYVVGGDVTTQQALDRRIRLAATFGG